MGSRPSAWRLIGRFPATLGIAVVTTAFFALEYAFGGATDLRSQIRLGAMRADRVAEHWELWRLVMPMLLHHGPLHLVLNGLAFLQLGALVEHLWGGRRLVLFYVASGIAGALASAAFSNGYAFSLGASGAIFGLAGVLLGASVYGDDSVRRLLADLRPRLRRAVFLTLVIGVGLAASGLVPIDNAAHIGGLLTGLLLALAYPDPLERDESATPGLVASLAVVVAAIGFAFAHGPRAVDTLAIDTARLLTERISRSPGSYGSLLALGQMLDWYDEAGEMDEGTDAFRRAVAKFDEPAYVRELSGALMLQAEAEGVDRDLAISAALERWLQLAPDDPEALNATAWHLVTAHAPERRDPARAEVLSRKSLERIPDPDTKYWRTQRASFLDTLGEALFQLGRYDEALEAQREAVELATALDLAVLAELSARLEKIEAAAG